jgi:hypothetical protein
MPNTIEQLKLKKDNIIIGKLQKINELVKLNKEKEKERKLKLEEIKSDQPYSTRTSLILSIQQLENEILTNQCNSVELHEDVKEFKIKELVEFDR